MSYTKPAGDNIHFVFTGSYKKPAGDAIHFNFQTIPTESVEIPPLVIGFRISMGSSEMQVPVTAMASGFKMELESYINGQVQVGIPPFIAGFRMAMESAEMQTPVPAMICSLGMSVEHVGLITIVEIPAMACGVKMSMASSEMQVIVPAMVGGLKMELESAQSLFSIPAMIYGFSLSLDSVITFSLDDAILRFILVLTGSENSVDDITLPMSYFQARRRSGSDTFLSVTIPTIDFASQIAVRSDGQLQIYQAYDMAGEILQSELIIETGIDSVASYEGGNNQSMVLTGYKTQTYTPKEIILTRPTYREFSGGTLKYRLAKPYVFLNPGDIVTIDSDTFALDVISYSISINQQLIQLEAE